MATISGDEFFAGGEATFLGNEGEVQKREEETGKPSFFKTLFNREETLEDIKEIGTGIKESALRRAEQFGEQETLLGKFGQATGFAGDIFGEAVIGAGKALLPQQAEEAVGETFQKGAQAVASLETVQEGLQAINKFKEENPELGEALDAVTNTTLLALDVASLGVAGRGARAVGREAVRATGDVATGVRAGGEALIEGGRGVVTRLGQRAVEAIPKSQAINTQVVKALDLTTGDLDKLYKSTDNQVGVWLADKNLIQDTKELTVKAIDDLTNESFTTVRNEIAKVDNIYAQADLPAYRQALDEIKDTIGDVVGLEDLNKEIDTLIAKEQLTLGDVQTVKEHLDEVFSLYKVTGEVKDAVKKKGLANVRSDLREFIEKEVELNTGADIRALNNDVATGKGLLAAIALRAPKTLTKRQLEAWDFGTFFIGSSLGGPLLGGAAVLLKRYATSPGFRLKSAKWLDKLDDAEKARALDEINSGKIPEGIEG